MSQIFDFVNRKGANLKKMGFLSWGAAECLRMAQAMNKEARTFMSPLGIAAGL